MAKLKIATAPIVILCVCAAGANLIADTPAEKPSKAERTDLYGDPLPPRALVRMGTIRFRNRGSIGTVAFSADGKVIAAGGVGGAILLYDSTTGRKLRELRAITNVHSIPALAFAPDGKTLASVGRRTIQIWDAVTGKELRRFKAEVSNGYTHSTPFVYSRDGKMLACAAFDHSLHLWDVKSGKELVKMRGHRNKVHCLAFSADGKTLLSADSERYTAGSARVWSVTTGEQRKEFPLLGGGEVRRPGTPLCFAADGKTLAFAAEETWKTKKGRNVLVYQRHVVSFLDLGSGAVRRGKLTPQEEPYQSAVFSRDGKFIATMNAVRRIRNDGLLTSLGVNRIGVWDAVTGKRLFAPPDYAEHFHDIGGPHLLAFAPDGKKLAAATLASSLRVWNVERGCEQLEKSTAHQNMVQCVVFSPDGRTLASAGSDSTIALWDAVTGRRQRQLQGHIGTVTSLAFSPDGKQLASASSSADQTVRLWDVATGKELHRYWVPDASIGEGDKGPFVSVTTWVAFTANGKILAAGGSDRKTRLWDAASGKEIRNQTIAGLRTPPKVTKSELFQWPTCVADVAFTPDGRTMALCAGNIISIVDMAAAQPLFQFEKKGFPAILALSPDGKTLLHGAGKSFRLLEVASGKDLHKRELNGKVFAAAFSPDGRTVAVSAGDSRATTALFDVRTGEEIAHLRGPGSRVRSLAFSPNGVCLASGQWDSTALVWDVSAARRKLPAKHLLAGDLERLWTDLKEEDAAKAHAALWTLAAAPDEAVPFLKKHLHLVAPIAADRLRRLLADLDADDFARRERASHELSKLGVEVEPALRRLLDGKPSLETRRRVRELLRHLPCQTAMTPDALRQLRSIQVLEQIASANARQILTSLAQGAAAAPATRDAKAALARLTKKRARAH